MKPILINSTTMGCEECPKRAFFVIKSVIKLCCRKVWEHGLSRRWRLAFNFFSWMNGPRLVVKKKWKQKQNKDFIHNCMLYKKGQDFWFLFLLVCLIFSFVLVSCRLALPCLVLLVLSCLVLSCVVTFCLVFSSVVLCVLWCIVLLCCVVLCCVVLSSLLSCLVLSLV